MIEIIAHRGFWTTPEEKNTLVAFRRATEQGFGIETDFRDRDGALYISHDVLEKNPIPVEEFFSLIRNSGLPMALNIKADGLQDLLYRHVHETNLKNYFVFDASIPDLLGYIKKKMTVYSRLSEFESLSSIDGYADGYWVDQFYGSWFLHSSALLLNLRKNLCFVSPELHRRNYEEFWYFLKSNIIKEALDLDVKIQVCTDFPGELRKYLDAKN